MKRLYVSSNYDFDAIGAIIRTEYSPFNGRKLIQISRKKTPNYGENKAYRKFIENDLRLGDSFNFSDEVWDLHYRATQATRGYGNVLDFTDIPQWIRPSIKAFLAWRLAFEKSANGVLKQTITACEKFAKYLTTYHPDMNSISELDLGIASGFANYVSGLQTNEVMKFKLYSPVRKFANFLKEKNKHIVSPNFYLLHRFNGYTKPKTLAEKKKKAAPPQFVNQLWARLEDEEEQLWKALHRIDEEYISSIKYRKSKAKKLESALIQRVKASNHLVYCQALKIIIATGRRSSHVLLCGRNPLIPTKEDEAKGIWFQWNETKMKKAMQKVFVPYPLSEDVIQAVRTAQELTSDMALSELETQLFIKRDTKGKHMKISYYDMKNWFSESRGQGFLKRHKIIYDVDMEKVAGFHQFRHHRATALKLGGASIGTIQADLKHRTVNMTDVYMDRDAIARDKFETLVINGDLKGYMTELVYNKEVKLDALSTVELESFREIGLLVQTTRYGYCTMPLTKGPCPYENKCYINCDGGEGCCKYHLYGPEDVTVMVNEIDVYAEDLAKELEHNPESIMAQHYKAIIAHKQSLLNEIDQKVVV
ncbi:tyrosine-type recombinase/integrase [Paenibacillus sp. Soil787]|uniref:tyrosine-type recombinase/integrase n=1 Tax=Paenibacillus sp. Soil787 TaxID=1736411 RepID=UPI0007038F10|nr:tyrosine-type recombinase/integrase [Paenibacillus sp. Soil787]KRF22521.1 hypothetical protein ASG93_29840 [Paenibacillus sp. Soil787]